MIAIPRLSQDTHFPWDIGSPVLQACCGTVVCTCDSRASLLSSQPNDLRCSIDVQLHGNRESPAVYWAMEVGYVFAQRHHGSLEIRLPACQSTLTAAGSSNGHVRQFCLSNFTEAADPVQLCNPYTLMSGDVFRTAHCKCQASYVLPGVTKSAENCSSKRP